MHIWLSKPSLLIKSHRANTEAATMTITSLSSVHPLASGPLSFFVFHSSQISHFGEDPPATSPLAVIISPLTFAPTKI
ncbi:hypothetical protein Ddc_01590 [Ditylenchus destructor]|nr:hypothetical protein Ddc_01590 [Ditylenchus destructor]